MSSVIHMDVQEGVAGEQTIIMNVHENERGPQGEQGEQGRAATIKAGNAYTVSTDSQPAVMNTGTDQDAVFDFYIPKGIQGESGKDGVVQYTAGKGIRITEDNVIYATGGGGGGGGAWGEIEGDINDQTDLQQEFAQYAKSADLATVATTGAYADLSGKPTIPTVNNATLTIQSNGTTAGTFTANSATNTTVNITSPTIEVTATDPGEGSPLAENHFVAVYGTNTSLLDFFYPVGSYYETSSITFNPNTAWGGTWVEDSTGKVTVSQDSGTFSTIGDTGGRESTNHVFYRPPLNSSRAQDAGITYVNKVVNDFANPWLQSGGSSALTLDWTVAQVAGDVRTDGTLTTEVGDYKYTSTNLQPYVVVKRWHRVA